MEIRTKPLKCLNSGDRVGLLSCCKQNGRRLLAILEYQHMTTLTWATFPRFFAKHRVTQDDLLTFMKEEKHDGKKGSFYGWQFETIHIFSEPLAVSTSTGSVVWCYFSLEPGLRALFAQFVMAPKNENLFRMYIYIILANCKETGLKHRNLACVVCRVRFGSFSVSAFQMIKQD